MTAQLSETIRVPMRMPNYWRFHLHPWRDGLWRFFCEGGGDGFSYGVPIPPRVSVCATRAQAAEYAALWSLAFWCAQLDDPVDAEQLASRWVGVKAMERYCKSRGITFNPTKETPGMVTKAKLGRSTRRDAAAANGVAQRKARAKQTKISGTYDPIPADVERAVEEYNESLGEWQRLQKQTDDLRADAIQRMNAHDIERVPIDEDTEFVRVHKDETWTIKKVKIKRPAAPRADED